MPGEAETGEKEILAVLLTDPEETLLTLVRKSEPLLRLNRRTGDVILLPPRSVLLDRQLVGLYFLGRYFAFKLGLAKGDEFTLDELQRLTGLDSKSLLARLSDMKSEGLIDGLQRGTYRVSYLNLKNFSGLLDDTNQTVSGTPSSLTIEFEPSDTSQNSYFGLDFNELTDTDAVLVALYASRATPTSEIWISADEISSWLRSQGSPAKEETLKKYTLPQHPVLKFSINRTKFGKQRRYQLLPRGLDRVMELIKKTGGTMS